MVTGEGASTQMNDLFPAVQIDSPDPTGGHRVFQDALRRMT